MGCVFVSLCFFTFALFTLANDYDFVSAFSFYKFIFFAKNDLLAIFTFNQNSAILKKNINLCQQIVLATFLLSSGMIVIIQCNGACDPYLCCICSHCDHDQNLRLAGTVQSLTQGVAPLLANTRLRGKVEAH